MAMGLSSPRWMTRVTMTKMICCPHGISTGESKGNMMEYVFWFLSKGNMTNMTNMILIYSYGFLGFPTSKSKTIYAIATAQKWAPGGWVRRRVTWLQDTCVTLSMSRKAFHDSGLLNQVCGCFHGVFVQFQRRYPSVTSNVGWTPGFTPHRRFCPLGKCWKIILPLQGDARMSVRCLPSGKLT